MDRTFWRKGAPLAVLAALFLCGCEEEHHHLEQGSLAPTVAPSASAPVESAPLADSAWGEVSHKVAPSLRRLDAARLQKGWFYIVELDEAFLPEKPPKSVRALGPEWVKRYTESLQEVKEDWRARVKIPTRAIEAEYRSLPYTTLKLDKSTLDRVLRSEMVSTVYAVEEVDLYDASSLPYMGLTADAAGINTDSSAGAGTTVAVIDTAARYWHSDFGSCSAQESFQANTPGCSIHTATSYMECAIGSAQYAGWGCVNNYTEYDISALTTEHGTNVAGIVHQVAPGAGIWALNAATVLYNPSQNSFTNVLYNSSILKALDDINQNPGNVVSVNMSLGSKRSEGDTSYCQSSFHSAIKALWDNHGIVSVVAAGNDGHKNGVSSPACDPYVITVGAQYDTDYNGYSVSYSSCSEAIQTGEVTCFSNSQTSVDIIAPGAFILAGGIQQGGTSQATPHVAGYTALLQSNSIQGDASRRLGADELVNRVRRSTINHNESAQDVSGAARNYTHRRLVDSGGLAPEAYYPLYIDPDGMSIPAGGSQTITVSTSDYASREYDLTNEDVTDIWLDITLEHTNASLIDMTVTSPDGTSRVLTGSTGSNINYIYGSQVDSSFSDAFDEEGAQGTWTLTIANRSNSEAATLYRASLMLSTETGTPAASSTYGSFALSNTSMVANATESQTFTLNLNSADQVDEVQFLINRSGHSTNGKTEAGYFRVTSSACEETGGGAGNDRVRLDTARCTITRPGDGSAAFGVTFVAETAMDPATAYSVSARWYENGELRSDWIKVSDSAGFDVTSLPSTFGSFSMDLDSVEANNTEVQKLRLVLNTARNVDDVRFAINFPAHATNGLDPAGYFVFSGATCAEYGAVLGNPKVALQTSDCEVNVNADNSVEFVMPFVLSPLVDAGSDYTVSVLWREGGVVRTGWRHVTSGGNGFEVAAAAGNVQRPSTFGSFSMDQSTFEADGTTQQTFRLTLNDASNVDDVRFLINKHGHAENGYTYNGYLQITDSLCREYGSGLGNADIVADTGSCERNPNPDGSVEYVINFAALPTFETGTNHQVSVLWFENGEVRTSWVRATSSGNGFAVTDPTGDVQRPSTFGSFSMDETTFEANGTAEQTFRLTLNDASNVDDVRFLINKPGHAENGSTYNGYLQITGSLCREYGSGLGNADIVADTGSCERNSNPDGSVEYVISFAAQPTFETGTNHQVSVLWFENGEVRGTWTRATSSGSGFAVTDPTGDVQRPSTFGSFSMDETSVTADGAATQTFRLTLNDGANVDQVRFLVNHPWHAENDYGFGGYFLLTTSACVELTQGFNNTLVDLDGENCAINTNPDGSVEFVVSFTIDASFGTASNNHVSVIWFEGDTPRSGWKRVTSSGSGYDVAP